MMTMGWSSDPWLVAIVVLLAASALSILAWLHIRFWERVLSVPLHYDGVEVHRAPDGGRFELRHVTAASQAVQAGLGSLPPVLLVHGICANHRNQDACDQASLARYLASNGRDVWLATLRSGRPWRLREGWQPAGFSAMARYDVPMAVARVLNRTNAPRLDYVGFSMGGMLLYASVGRGVKPEQLRRVVVVGSPGRVQPPIGVPRFLRFLPVALVPPILTGLLGTGFAFLSEWLVTPIHRIILNPRNVAPGATRQALVDVVQDVPGRLLADFMLWATTGGVVRVEGEDILERLTSVNVPAFFVAGTLDRLGPPAAVRKAYEAWGCEVAGLTKGFLELGRTTGAQEDYGHGDLAVGCRLADELYPLVGTFLGDEDPPRLATVAATVAARVSLSGPVPVQVRPDVDCGSPTGGGSTAGPHHSPELEPLS